ncbi:MAG: DUF177 domain-containing protein [Candidatus Aminicenantes bacterium]|nr:DUF177 domain-containing protein [Candidatus Aminicenantes bacterium]
MLIDIDRLPKEGIHVSRDFEFLSVELVEENAVFLEPTRADVLVQRVGEEIWIKGRVSSRLSFVCSRCLTPFEFPIDSKFDLVYMPEEMAAGKDELNDEDMDRMFYSDRNIDLRSVILEQLNLTFPPKPLCSEACEGICAVCGELIRDGTCACLVKESDFRFEKLKFLVKDKS